MDCESGIHTSHVVVKDSSSEIGSGLDYDYHKLMALKAAVAP